MNGISRFLLATATGIVLGTGVHIFVVLASPRFAEHDAIGRIPLASTPGAAAIISSPGENDTWMPLPDPAFAVAACTFDLEDGPARIAAETDQSFLSFSLHTKTSGVFFAVTDRAAIRGRLEIVVMTPRQLDEARAEEDENEPSRDVRIVAPGQKVYAVIRVAAPTSSQRAAALKTASAVSCVTEGDEEE